ncbi:MAG TPA: hypothetical protein VNF47_14125 [Streptosporangiaceae bacterium]|nr:hypothetical protein [Streptosporangiaceae bacterium]
MSPSTKRSLTFAVAGRRGAAGVAAAALMLGTVISGCSVVNKINSIQHAVEGNKATIDNFAKGLQNGKAVPFEVTYVTTGSSPATITYAVQPPREVGFKESGNSGGAADFDLVINSAGEYSCSQSSAGAQWSCVKLGNANAAAQNQIFNIYTPAHWITFLTGFSTLAGIAGDKVTTSTMTVNGFNLNCVDFSAKGVPGISTICSTDQGILGYVKVASNSASFEIKSYTASPPTSDFALPSGATVTNAGNGG